MYERSLVPQYMYDPGDAVPPPAHQPPNPGQLNSTNTRSRWNKYLHGPGSGGGGGPGHDGEQIVMETGTARESKKRE